LSPEIREATKHRRQDVSKGNRTALVTPRRAGALGWRLSGSQGMQLIHS
jgi:hypothetical protein